MAEKFNLLPKKQKGSERETKLTKLIKSMAIIFFVVTVLILGGETAFLFLSESNLKKVNQKVESTKGQISALESAELGLVVSKDRAQKIRKLLDLRQNERSYKKYIALTRDLPGTIELTEMDLSDSSTEATFTGTNSKEFSDFLGSFILNKSDYGVIYFNSVGLGEKSGYKLVLELE